MAARQLPRAVSFPQTISPPEPAEKRIISADDKRRDRRKAHPILTLGDETK